MLGIYRQVTAFKDKSLPSGVFLLVVFLMCFKQKNLFVGTEAKNTVTEGYKGSNHVPRL